MPHWEHCWSFWAMLWVTWEISSAQMQRSVAPPLHVRQGKGRSWSRLTHQRAAELFSWLQQKGALIHSPDSTRGPRSCQHVETNLWIRKGLRRWEAQLHLDGKNTGNRWVTFLLLATPQLPDQGRGLHEESFQGLALHGKMGNFPRPPEVFKKTSLWRSNRKDGRGGTISVHSSQYWRHSCECLLVPSTQRTSQPWSHTSHSCLSAPFGAPD